MNELSLEFVGNNDLITIEALPVISAQLRAVEPQIRAYVESTLALEVSENTVKEVKKSRAELNRIRTAISDRVREIKKQILEPYDAIESEVKRFVTGYLDDADAQLKERINEVEDGLKNIKRTELMEWCIEYADSQNVVEWVSALGEKTGLYKVNLSNSLPALKRAAKTRIDELVSDLNALSVFPEEDKPELFAEFERSLSASQAITALQQRKQEKLRAEARAKEYAERLAAQQAAQAIEPEPVVEKATISTAAPVITDAEETVTIYMPPTQTETQTTQEEPIQPEKLYRVRFIIEGNLEQMKIIKAAIVSSGAQWSQEKTQ